MHGKQSRNKEMIEIHSPGVNDEQSINLGVMKFVDFSATRVFFDMI